MDSATPTIDWQAIGAELLRIAPGGITIDYTPRTKAPSWATDSAAWFIGDGDIEAFGATFPEAMAEFIRLRAEAVQS